MCQNISYTVSAFYQALSIRRVVSSHIDRQKLTTADSSSLLLCGDVNQLGTVLLAKPNGNLDARTPVMSYLKPQTLWLSLCFRLHPLMTAFLNLNIYKETGLYAPYGQNILRACLLHCRKLFQPVTILDVKKSRAQQNHGSTSKFNEDHVIVIAAYLEELRMSCREQHVQNINRSISSVPTPLKLCSSVVWQMTSMLVPRTLRSKYTLGPSRQSKVPQWTSAYAVLPWPTQTARGEIQDVEIDFKKVGNLVGNMVSNSKSDGRRSAALVSGNGGECRKDIVQVLPGRGYPARGGQGDLPEGRQFGIERFRNTRLTAFFCLLQRIKAWVRQSTTRALRCLHWRNQGHLCRRCTCSNNIFEDSTYCKDHFLRSLEVSGRSAYNLVSLFE